MSKGFFEAELTGGEVIDAGLIAFELLLHDWRKPIQKSLQAAAASVEKTFETAGEGSWAPLSAATIRRTPGRAGGPLMNDLDLMGAATDTKGAEPGSAYSLKPDKGTIGVDKRVFPGAFALNFGWAPLNIPAREYIRLTEEDIITMEEIFGRRVDVLLGEAFP